jgi:signal transduction histidine kinase
VFTNLMSNALKYGDHKPIVVSLEATDRVARLAVKDGGIGISKAELKRIFVPFERATPMQAGLGLGLFISKQILEAHGGKIDVTSETGNGSTFTVTLPLKARGTTRKRKRK